MTRKDRRIKNKEQRRLNGLRRKRRGHGRERGR